MKKFVRLLIRWLEALRWLPLLAFRLFLACGFYIPASVKIGNIGGVVSFFNELHIPYPVLSAYLSTIFECLGVILLVLGLFTRLISIPLMVILGVAIYFVHWPNGFGAGNNGFEVPLSYFLMLLALLILGPGKVSLDGLLRKKIDKVQ